MVHLRFSEILGYSLADKFVVLEFEVALLFLVVQLKNLFIILLFVFGSVLEVQQFCDIAEADSCSFFLD